MGPTEKPTIDADTGEEIYIADIIAPGKIIFATQCAMRLQNAYRRKLDRRAKATSLQAKARAYLAKRRVQVLRERRAALRLQRIFRGHREREKVAELEELEWVALVFQSYWRGTLARRERHRRERIRACIVMQRWYRGRRTRRGLVVRWVYTYAAVSIQAGWRGHLGRQEASWRLFMSLWLQEFSPAEVDTIRFIQGHWRGRIARRQMVAFRRVVQRARAATVIQRYARGRITRKAVGSARQRHDWAWSLYRDTPSATEQVYKRQRELEKREERSHDRTIALSTVSGGTVTRTLTKPPLLPAERRAGPVAATLATTPVTPLHLLMRSAKEDGFRLPAIGDVRSHSPALDDGPESYGEPRTASGRRRVGAGGVGAVAAAGRLQARAGGRRRRRRGSGADGGGQIRAALRAVEGPAAERRARSVPRLEAQ